MGKDGNTWGMALFLWENMGEYGKIWENRKTPYANIGGHWHDCLRASNMEFGECNAARATVFGV